MRHCKTGLSLPLVHTQRVAVQHEKWKILHYLLCAVLLHHLRCEHPNWQKLFPFCARVTQTQRYALRALCGRALHTKLSRTAHIVLVLDSSLSFHNTAGQRSIALSFI